MYITIDYNQTLRYITINHTETQMYIIYVLM